MGDWIGNNIAVLEMVLSALVVFGFLGWQYWTTRGARFPDENESAPPPRHPEG
jgi:hypothetical protein